MEAKQPPVVGTIASIPVALANPWNLSVVGYMKRIHVVGGIIVADKLALNWQGTIDHSVRLKILLGSLEQR